MNLKLKRQRKQYPAQCSHPRCRRKVRRSEHSDKCCKHRLAAFREKHPLKYSFGNLRRRAKERCVPFHLTFEQYEAFAIKTDYARLKGKTSLSLSVDRKENSLGYWPWNLQAISLRENSRKEYVPRLQQMGLTSREREKLRHFDKAERDLCEQLAAEIAKHHPPGSDIFWKEFNRRKFELFETATA